MQKTRSSITRRDFINKSAALTFGFTVMPSYLALGKEDSEGNLPPSKKINMAHIGTGGMGGGDTDCMIRTGHVNPVAFCDVDSGRGRFEQRKKNHPKAQFFKDFRVMLDKVGKDVDAVSVGTPDHTHFVAAMDAMRRGKHVFVQKPLTHSFREAELLIKAEKKYNVVTQMGNQGHTSTASRQFARMVKEGIVKDIVKIDAWKSSGLFFMDADKRFSEYPPEMPIPESLDWDLWCGPAEKKPYNKKYHPFNWRAFYLYGLGMFGDWGAHIIDYPHDFLNLGLPTKIKALRMDDHNKVLFPLTSHVSMHFPARGADLPACDLFWRSGGDCHPEVDEKYLEKNEKGETKKPNLGGAGTLLHSSSQDEYLVSRHSHGSASRIMPYAKMKELGSKMKVERPKHGHRESFVQACMGNEKTMSPFSISGPLTQVLCIGAVCEYLNQDLEFDRDKKRFVNNDAANAVLDGPAPRKGYEEFYKAI